MYARACARTSEVLEMSGSQTERLTLFDFADAVALGDPTST
jgi:hypothetical protein